ncbi:hypothetical protein XAC3607_4180015 [Xanthomonas citri pv. citri]|nr:hypothetical protein XAC3615_13090004 [Xanthomonas citri pv. citri]CEH93967.1 hypothetical protein XAC3607_4180015 [Xanthomonas citri pv. citri]
MAPGCGVRVAMSIYTFLELNATEDFYKSFRV